MRPDPIDVSILIVNWNSLRYLRPCLTTIREHVRGLTYEVIVVDNASYDGSAEMLAGEFPWVRYVQSDKNLGFARANNLAFHHCAGEHVLLLNPDTEMTDDAVSTMLAHLKSDQWVGAVGCSLVNSDSTPQWQYTQAFPTILNQVLGADALQRAFPRSRLWGTKPALEYKDRPLEAEVLAGSCIMVRRTVFEQVGQFSDQYYMYGDDVDLCYKIREAGYSVQYIGSKKIVHHGGTSSAFRKENEFSTVMQKESLFKFFHKTRGGLYAAAYRIAMGAVAVVRLFVIALMMPVAALSVGRGSLSGAARKWWTVLRWAAGQEKWAARLGQ